MHWKLVTDATTEPITTAQAKKHLNVSISDDDTYIDILIKVARQSIERATDRALLNQTWRLYLENWPSGKDERIYLPYSPVSSIESIKYTDTAGDQQTWTNTEYQKDYNHEPCRISPAYGYTYPSIRSADDLSHIIIEYVSGYGADIGTATLLPKQMTQALYLLVGHLYEHREPVVTGTIISDFPLSIQFLIDQMSVGWMYDAGRFA